MSRIGKKPIALPTGVTISVSNENVVSVKGPKGTLVQSVRPEFKVELEDGQLTVVRPNDEKQNRAYHGLYRALLNNMVFGVANGYQAKMELVGVGYKAVADGQILELNLGYSHSIFFQIPSEVSVSAETLKGKNPVISLACADKQLLGHITSKLRSLRKPEPYKGKGVKFVGEVLRRKAGKSSGKKK
jgi:large subunit ribosomal protein L6